MSTTLLDRPTIGSLIVEGAHPSSSLSPTGEPLSDDQIIHNELNRLFDNAEKTHRELLREQLMPYAVSLASDLPEPRPVIAREGGAIIGSEGNISAIVGEAKSRKSFLCTAIVGDVTVLEDHTPKNGFVPRFGRVVWIDTEQSQLHVRKVARRLSLLSGWSDDERIHPLIQLYALREEPPKERMQILRTAIEAWNPRLVVIDGVADLQLNTNDLEESERIVTELMALSSIYNCHILCVLHTNPNSDKARGHLGSSLQRKAETVLYVHKVGERSVVEPQFCRNEPFERFAFTIENGEDRLGIPQPTELPTESEAGKGVVAELLLNEYGGAAERMVVTNKLVERGATLNNARVMIHRALKRGDITLDATGKLLQLPEVEVPEPF